MNTAPDLAPNAEALRRSRRRERMALLSLGCVLMLKLPPGDRFKTFEPLDFLTFAILASGVALLCAVLSLGRIDWWLEADWIGYALAASIALILAGLGNVNRSFLGILQSQEALLRERYSLAFTIVGAADSGGC